MKVDDGNRGMKDNKIDEIMNVKKIIKKTSALLLIFMFIISIFSFAFQARLVYAQNGDTGETSEQPYAYGCCTKLGDKYGGQTCIDIEISEKDKCEGMFYSFKPCSEVAECIPGTCIMPSGFCVQGKSREECEGSGGRFIKLPIEEIEECKKGCCIVAGGINPPPSVVEKARCYVTASEYGYSSEEVEFDPSIKNEVDCNRKAGQEDLGCCILGGGNCKYTTRAECNSLGGFFPDNKLNVFCKYFKECAVIPCTSVGCGKLPGTENKICCFDSQGNQEECGTNKKITLKRYVGNAQEEVNVTLEECNFPEKICVINKTTGLPYCKDTKCEVNLSGSQIPICEYETAEGERRGPENCWEIWERGDYPINWKGLGESEEGIVNKGKKTMYSGTSICYNFFTHWPLTKNDDPASEQKKFAARSTGLVNEILHCSYGEVTIEASSPAREKFCVPAKKWKNQGGGSTVTLITSHGKFVENEWRECKKCGEGGGIFGTLADFFGPIGPFGKLYAAIFGGHYCTPRECASLGHCVYNIDRGGGREWLGWVGWLAWVTPIGSCDPFFTPGTNYLTAENMMEETTKKELEGEGGAKIETPNIECGGGGDGIWNLCTEAECEASGDYIFEDYPGWKEWIGGIALAAMVFYISKVISIPVEAALCVVPWCNVGQLWKHRTETYLIGPWKIIWRGIGLHKLFQSSSSGGMDILGKVVLSALSAAAGYLLAPPWGAILGGALGGFAGGLGGGEGTGGGAGS